MPFLKFMYFQTMNLTSSFNGSFLKISRLFLLAIGFLGSTSYIQAQVIFSDSFEGSFTQTRCGNGLFEVGEQCDDGNSISGDGCSAVCRIEANSITNTLNTHSAVGMNMIWLADWESFQPFMDAFKHSRPFTSVLNDAWGDGTLDLDENGWVRSLQINQQAATPILVQQDGAEISHKYPSGDYVLSWEGEGEFRVDGASVNEIIVSSNGGRRLMSLDFSDANANLHLYINVTNPGNYLRNFHLYSPGGVCDRDPFTHYDDASSCTGSFESYEQVAQVMVFHPGFLKNHQHYRALRFMQTWGTQDSIIVNPLDIKNIHSESYSEFIPPEIIALMGNALNADVWINIPHRATDQTINLIAQRIRDNINPNLTVYVEFSNEVWNFAPGFPQGGELGVIGCRSGRYPDLETGCDQDETPNNGVLCEGYPYPNWISVCNDARIRYFADRTAESIQIFEQVFAERAGQINGVLGAFTGEGGMENGQWNGGGWDAQAMDWLQSQGNFGHIDSMATAPYYGAYLSNGEGAIIVQDWLNQGGESHALDQFFTEIMSGGPAYSQFIQGGQFYDPDRDFWDYPPQNGALAGARFGMNIDAQKAQAYGLDLIAYEGGSHFHNYEGNTAVQNLFDTAKTDPRMQQVYEQYLADWRSAGGKTFIHYSSHGNDHFGLIQRAHEDVSQLPIFQGIFSFMQSNPCWWNACSRP